jgi:hypothetical protein
MASPPQHNKTGVVFESIARRNPAHLSRRSRNQKNIQRKGRAKKKKSRKEPDLSFILVSFGFLCVFALKFFVKFVNNDLIRD